MKILSHNKMGGKKNARHALIHIRSWQKLQSRIGSLGESRGSGRESKGLEPAVWQVLRLAGSGVRLDILQIPVPTLCLFDLIGNPVCPPERSSSGPED